MFNPSAKKFRSSCSVNLTLEILVAHIVSQGGVQNCRFGSSAGKGYKDTKKYRNDKESEHTILTIDIIIQRFDTFS
jgi:hypothetical protein